jgi:hypothetical protein
LLPNNFTTTKIFRSTSKVGERKKTVGKINVQKLKSGMSTAKINNVPNQDIITLRDPLSIEEELTFMKGKKIGEWLIKNHDKIFDIKIFDDVFVYSCCKYKLLKIFIDGLAEGQHGEILGPDNFINKLMVTLSFYGINNYIAIKHHLCEKQLKIDNKHEWVINLLSKVERKWSQRLVKHKRTIVSNTEEDNNLPVYKLSLSRITSCVACNNVPVCTLIDSEAISESRHSIDNMI